MATAYIFFGKAFTPESATALVQAGRVLMGDHQVRWNFPTNNNVPLYVINEAVKWLGTYENMMTEYVADRSGQTKETILNMMREGTTVSPAQAKALGLIHDVCECSIPQDARSYQV